MAVLSVKISDTLYTMFKLGVSMTKGKWWGEMPGAVEEALLCWLERYAPALLPLTGRSLPDAKKTISYRCAKCGGKLALAKVRLWFPAKDVKTLVPIIMDAVVCADCGRVLALKPTEDMFGRILETRKELEKEEEVWRELLVWAGVAIKEAQG